MDVKTDLSVGPSVKYQRDVTVRSVFSRAPREGGSGCSVEGNMELAGVLKHGKEGEIQK